MPYREVTVSITEATGSVTDGTINTIQSANESVKKQLIDRYCGRLSTWEASWFSALKAGQIILEAHDAYGHWFSPVPVLPAFSSGSTSNSSGSAPNKSCNDAPDKSSDRNSRGVSAINKVLARYNLVCKRRLH